jgi:hypothetical protein
MKSDVFTTPLEERYIIHHSSWGVVDTSLFMGSCKYIILQGKL